MPTSDLRAFPGRPVSAVRADDLRRVWTFLAPEPGGVPERSVSLQLLAGLCDSNADPLAVWFRVTLVNALAQQGRLDRWRDGDSLHDKVFEIAATFPLPGGAGADVDAFVAALE